MHNYEITIYYNNTNHGVIMTKYIIVSVQLY